MSSRPHAVDLQDRGAIDLGHGVVPAGRLAAVHDHRVHPQAAGEHEGHGTALLDPVVEPLVAGVAFPPAGHPDPRHRRPRAQPEAHALQEGRGHVERVARRRHLFDGVEHEEEARIAPVLLAPDLLAQRQADLELVIGERALEEQVDVVAGPGGEDGHTDLEAVVAQVVPGHDPHGVAAGDAGLRPGDGPQPVPQLGRVVLGGGEHQGQVAGLGPGLGQGRPGRLDGRLRRRRIHAVAHTCSHRSPSRLSPMVAASY